MRPIDLMDALGDLPEDYIARELTYQPPKKNSIPFRAVIAAAACLLLTAGLVRGVWMKRQPIDTVPPQETLPTTETLPTEPVTTDTTAVQTSESGSEAETTASESASETAFSATAAWTETIETVTLPVQSIPALTQPASSTEATHPAATAVTTVQTDPTESPTESSITMLTTVKTGDAAENETPAEDETESPAEGIAETTAYIPTDPTEPIDITDPPEPTEPSYSLPGNLTPDSSGRDPLDGFTATECFGRTVLTVTPESDDPTDFSLGYTCTDRRYFQESMATDVAGGIWNTAYTYLDRQNGTSITVRLYCRSRFRLEYRTETAQYWRLDRPDGCIYLHCDAGGYVLYDDGNYVMQIEYNDPQADYQGFLEHFVPKN